MYISMQHEHLADHCRLLDELDDPMVGSADQIEYLRRVVTSSACGPHLVDVGCGLGERAIKLARSGFKVTGLDIDGWALSVAADRAHAAGVHVCWEAVDLRGSARWPVANQDAVICGDVFGIGTDAQRRALLRKLRQCLKPNGTLVLSQLNPIWLLQHRVDTTIKSGETSVRYQQHYDPVQGRNRVCLTVSRSGFPPLVAEQEIRLYFVPELSDLLRQAGFEIDRIDADFTSGRCVEAESKTIHVFAHALVPPPQALAVAKWGAPANNHLNLRYAPDEPDWLDPSPDQLWAEVLQGDGQYGAIAASLYPVDDPYGAKRGTEVVSKHFGCPMTEEMVTFGSGVTSLLRDLAGLSDQGLVLAPELTHPDLAAWSIINGATVRLIDEAMTADRLIAEILAVQPSLIHLDRPTVAGELMSLAEIEAVGRAAAKTGALVLIDESPASYLGPEASCIPLVDRLDNLVVLRSVTKGYTRGGLRGGVAVASEAIANRVRELVPPLQVSELSFRAVLSLLAAGDIFARLRARVHEVKPWMVSLLESKGLQVIQGHPDLAWVLVSDPDRTASILLEACDLQGLALCPSPVKYGSPPALLHLSIPLSNERIAAVAARLDGLPLRS